MATIAPRLTLDPLRALALDLPELHGPVRRGTLRALLALSGGSVSVTGADRLAAAPRPSIFALSHHNAWEAVLAPAALVALRRGRLVRFLVDWMFVDLPWTGWLVRQIEPIPVYAKPARFGLGEAHRARRLRAGSPVDLAVAALAGGDDVGIYPEGRRNPEPHLLLRGRLGLGLVALRSGAPVVPVGIDFAARDRLGRTPRLGRFALSVGDPIEVTEERAAWLEAVRGAEDSAAGIETLRNLERRLAPRIVGRVQLELARRSRKIYLETLGRSERLSIEPNRAAAPRLADSFEAVGRAAGGTTITRVDCAAARSAALAVLEEVYREEKRWLAGVDGEIALDAASDPGTSWFLARVDGEPAGTLRLQYDPPLAMAPEVASAIGLELEPGVDLAALARAGRWVEVGRLTIAPGHRRRPSLVLALMREAMREVESRGGTHLFTAVFENDPHSPLGFHTRVLGFERIGTHTRGELASDSRRILLVLDLARARRRLERAKPKLAAALAAAPTGSPRRGSEAVAAS